jgi:transposase
VTDDHISEEAQELLERVAAIDIAKASAVVCTRIPHDTVPGRRVQEVRTVRTDTASILDLGDHLRCLGIQRVVMEATGTYWKPFFQLLEGSGLQVWLVNARDVKNVPGRPKTDRLDAIWLAKLNERGMLRASFVPARPIRELRDLTRTRAVFIHERTRHKQRVEKLLEDAQIKLSCAISDLFGQSGRAILDALADGERRPAQLAALAVGNLRYKQDKLRTALVGQFTDHHGYLLTVLLTMVDTLTAEIDRLTTRIEQHLADTDPPTGPPATGRPGLLDLVDRIDEIPGVGPRAAQIILAEIGPDMTVFPTAGHLASWAKLSPRTLQSGQVTATGRTGKGNPWLRAALGEAAASAARTDTFLGTRYKRLVKRRGHQRALVAVARSILVIIWHLANDPTARYRDLGPDWHTRHGSPQRKTHDLVRQLERLGHHVTLAPATP